MNVYDNSQKNFPHKYQTNGSTSTFLKGTSRITIKLVQCDWMLFPVLDWKVPTIEYVHQAIVSPLFMPRYELNHPSSHVIMGRVLKQADSLPDMLQVHQSYHTSLFSFDDNNSVHVATSDDSVHVERTESFDNMSVSTMSNSVSTIDQFEMVNHDHHLDEPLDEAIVVVETPSKNCQQNQLSREPFDGVTPRRGSSAVSMKRKAFQIESHTPRELFKRRNDNTDTFNNEEANDEEAPLSHDGVVDNIVDNVSEKPLISSLLKAAETIGAFDEKEESPEDPFEVLQTSAFIDTGKSTVNFVDPVVADNSSINDEEHASIGSHSSVMMNVLSIAANGRFANDTKFQHDVDISGKRVEGWMRHVFMSYEFNKQHRYLSLPKKHYEFKRQEHVDDEFCNEVRDAFYSLRKRGGLFHRSEHFQRYVVEQRRGKKSSLEVLWHPLSLADPTTNVGNQEVIIDILVENQLLIPTGKKVNKVMQYKLGDGIDKKYVLLVGDGLTQVRYYTCKTKLLSMVKSFKIHYDQQAILGKAMEQVFMIPGDLHAGCFHTIGPVYKLFYGGFLQVFQTVLGWKKINARKVECTYQQCAFLLSIVLGECERQLYDMFAFTFSELQKAQFRSFANTEDAAQYFGTEFVKWIDNKIETTSDGVFRFVLQFVKVGRCYESFRKTTSKGDEIGLEYQYIQFLPIWAVLNKSTSVELALCQIEEFYSRAPYHILQIVRDNRLCQIHDDSIHNLISFWALDNVIESTQPSLKIAAQNNKAESWQANSYNVPICL